MPSRMQQVFESMIAKLATQFPTMTPVTDPKAPVAAGQIRWIADVKRFGKFSTLPSPLILIAYKGGVAKDGGNKSQGGVIRYIAGDMSLYVLAPSMGPVGEGTLDACAMLDAAFEALENEPIYVDGKAASRINWRGEVFFDLYDTSVCYEQVYDNTFVRAKVMSD